MNSCASLRWFTCRASHVEVNAAMLEGINTCGRTFVVLFRCFAGTISCKSVCLQGVAREVNAAVLEGINASGRAFLIHTELGGQFTMRMAIGAAHTQQRHIDGAWDLIREETERQLARMGDQSVMESAAA